MRILLTLSVALIGLGLLLIGSELITRDFSKMTQCRAVGGEIINDECVEMF